MRPVTLSLDVLVRDPVNDNAWPGANETIEFNDTTCPAVDDEVTKWLVELVFVVMGYDSNQGDSLPAASGWQIFSQEEAKELIPIWAAESLEFHAATKITCSNNPDNFYVVGNSIFDVLQAFTTCCAAPNILTQALVFKQSNAALDPTQQYPCGTLAIFKWLAILGNNETTPGLTYTFQIRLRNQFGDIDLLENFVDAQPLTATVQAVKQWPNDFIGMEIGGITLVANGATPGPSELRIGDFDYGSIDILVEITDGGSYTRSQTAQYALPSTDCGIFGPEFSEAFS
jgi:hypothetical protein